MHLNVSDAKIHGAPSTKIVTCAYLQVCEWGSFYVHICPLSVSTCICSSWLYVRVCLYIKWVCTYMCPSVCIKPWVYENGSMVLGGWWRGLACVYSFLAYTHLSVWVHILVSMVVHSVFLSANGFFNGQSKCMHVVSVCKCKKVGIQVYMWWWANMNVWRGFMPYGGHELR